MKTVFLCLRQSCKNISKYFVFSLFFFACLFAGSVVNAEGYSNYDDYTTGTDGNHDSSVTTINGVINNECKTGDYTIVSNSYKGNNSKTGDAALECISYTPATGKQIYYLQAQTSDPLFDPSNPDLEDRDSDTWNQVTFKVHNISTKYKFIIIAEAGYSKSDTTTTDYDIYSLNDTTGNYEYGQIRNKMGTTIQPDRTGSLASSAIYASGTYTFTYYLRNTEFREHNIYVYFYDAAAEADNLTPNKTITYTLAKPISDYKFNADVAKTSPVPSADNDCAVTAGSYEVCLEYTAHYNTGGTDDDTKTNTFTVEFSNAAAFYFSTVTSHSIPLASRTVADILTYNSIYATNTFYNDGSTDKIVYYYYNFDDQTSYLQGVTANSTGYKFLLTIDANGTYNFFLTDIFGNTLDPSVHNDDTDSPVIDDVSNKDLTIYYLVYENGTLTSYSNYGDNIDTAVRNFQLQYDTINALSRLTKENVTIGLEFYSTIVIEPEYGIKDETFADILMNPLYFANDTSDELRISDTTNSSIKLTYFCRLASIADDENDGYASSDCIDSSKSGYSLHALQGTQSISSNDYGKKAVSNNFTGFSGDKYFQGLLIDDLDSISSPAADSLTRHNRTNLVLNENGRFFIRIQDIYGNSTSSTIDVSIIDQHKPVVTLANQAASSGLENVICSSMYVVGAGGGIYEYPTGVLEETDCTNSVISYNMFEDIATKAYATEKQDTIRHELTRTVVEIDKTNGFYDMATKLATFNYADAIRIGLLRASDSVIIAGDYTSSGQATSPVEKSIYQKTVNTYTSYELRTLDRNGTSTTDITNSLTRVSYGYQEDAANGNAYIADSDLIIKNNYTQYSSELKYYDADAAAVKKEFVKFTVYEMLVDATGYSTTPACDSVTDRDNNVCNDIVNTFIDKGINFKLVFEAHDYVGNVSDPITLEIRVLDNTAPGIASIDANGQMLEDPTIARNNLDTTCRLEIGSVIQNKMDLLKCYGLVMSNGTYNYVDNSTAYMLLTKTEYNAASYGAVDYSVYNTTYTHSDRIYKFALSDQLFKTTNADDDSYYNHLRVYVCRTAGTGKCGGSEQPAWEEVTDATTLKFDNAGSYEIKFEITDVGHNFVTATGSQTHTPNKTVITLCYYVNPRVLLVRPIAKTVNYGSYALNDYSIDYCVYATTNTASFFYNLFTLDYDPTGTYKDTYDFVDQNYENSAGGNYGLVYCTAADPYSQGDSESSAIGKQLKDVLANEDASILGEMSITYATGANKYNMELNTYNAYKDVGYYYITMGNLHIGRAGAELSNTDFSENYVLRLHPSYLLDGMDPNDLLQNYDSTAIKNYKVDEDFVYKYGHDQDSYGETISNVLYTVEQAKLTITANGGSKTYGMVDTNYKQANNTNALVNASKYVDEDKKISTAGYLNGFTITGLINNTNVKDYSDATAGDPRYNYIIQGYLRREMGEKVGTYYVCNSTSIITKTTGAHADCDLNGYSLLTATKHTLYDTNVFYLDENGNLEPIEVGADYRYGMYIKIGNETDGYTYHKLTRDNTDLIEFTDTFVSDVWKYNYASDEEDYSVKILPNDNNGNQNYYIEYVDALYTINPGQIIVQPGSNQGKEYSNPQHNDPRFEIIVYGETRGITKSTYADGFSTGFTDTITDVTYPNAPVYTDNPYNVGAADVVDNYLYFTERRTTTRELFGGATFTYQFPLVDLVDDKTFDWMGANYTYNSGNVCLTSSFTNSSFTQCQEGKIGIYDVSVDTNTDKVTITTSGALTYQTYGLLAGESGTAGSATITRESPNSISVGWYSYVFSAAKMHVVTNGKTLCNVSDYIYTVSNTGTSECSNYNLDWDDSAPTNRVDNDTKQVTSSVTVANTGVKYDHNGRHYCGNIGTDGYSASCQTGGDEVKTIKFFIFKRDVIISFNLYEVTYGNVYSFFSEGIFTVEDSSNLPTFGPSGSETEIITCYKKDPSGAYVVNGIKYGKFTQDDINAGITCEGVEYGISEGDTWGSGTNGLNLKFFLAPYIQTGFTESTYAVPAGKYYVYATIGQLDLATNKWLHPNYNLVYVDYNVILTAEGKTFTDVADGVVNIVPREVDLYGTYYQKEYGQAMYNSYGNYNTQLTASGVGDGTYSARLANLKDSAVNKIFDNHYYYCDGTDTTYNGQAVKYGCEMVGITSPDHTNYGYGEINNLFGYTVSAVGGAANTGMITLAAGNADEIYANFAKTPVRQDVAPKGHSNLIDPYGLMDDVGFYTINLTDIVPTVAVYGGITFDTATTILRYTNYEIKNKYAGGLYITPASIDISVYGSQTKMYGCAYNTFNNNSTYEYSYGAGYTNCVESNGTLYDLGYKYQVSNDKYNYLVSKIKTTDDGGNAITPTLDYTTLKNTNNSTLVVCALENRNTGTGCYDIAYPGNDTYYKYDVAPSAPSGTFSFNKPDNTALNTGTLFRIPLTGTNTASSFEETYDYATYFNYATKAQISMGEANRIYQLQSVGDYVITLGNLDSATNAKKMCGNNSTPVGLTADYECKNFIINYDGNNTALHVFNGTTHSFTNNDTFTLDNTDLAFTITTRKVVMNTEYNYKIYGDTDPIEGFTCKNLKDMFGLTDYVGRDYCSGGDNTFIPTGVTRFYAVDNSLAKAPWTAWSVDTEVAGGATSYNTYNDILFDVIKPHISDADPGSQILRKGEGSDAADRYDAGGEYYYIYQLSLNSDLNGSNNYAINYITGYNSTDRADSTIGTITPVDGKVEGANVGFAGTTGEGDLARWYGDSSHACHSVASGGTNCEAAYTGLETYNFYINGITKEGTGSYEDSITYFVTYTDATSGATVEVQSMIAETVFFEIVHREIYIQTEAVNKNYGDEEDYLDFTLTLVTPNDTGTGYVPIRQSDDWGDPQSLSRDDYLTFFPETTPGSGVRAFSLEAFMGTANPAAFIGDHSNRAFGIYFYRTAGETVGKYVIVACATQYANDSRCRSEYADLDSEADRKAHVASFIQTPSSNTYNASNYIVYTIPAELTISERQLKITPNEGQGFQYGNYTSGTLIDPITYYEESTYAIINGSNAPDTAVRRGLVNGGTLNGADHVNNQIALCIYDISERITCINDRQNVSIAPSLIVGYVTTTLHHDPVENYDPSVAAGITTTQRTSDTFRLPEGATLLNYNVYNDEYTKDNDETATAGAYERYALNRVWNSQPNQRYNRNVGTYKIVAGELLDNRYCNATAATPITTNCLNVNYKVTEFVENKVYIITPANITITPNDNQTKVYGLSDVHLKFSVTTTFIYKDITVDPKADLYHCVISASKCQSHSTFTNATFSGSSGNETVTINGFAYAENTLDGSDNMEDEYNYGVSRVSNKSNAPAVLDSPYSTSVSPMPTDRGNYPRYYDKYCLGTPDTAEGCTAFTTSVRYAHLTYGETSRILLGYFYVEDYNQTASTLNIMNGIIVASNEFGEKNYAYSRSIDQDTGVDFVITQLEIDATIMDVTKVYGQATDSHKADALTHDCTSSGTNNCIKDYAVGMNTAPYANKSLNNEDRLEYNFNVTDSIGSINGEDLVILTSLHGGNYYTQTGGAETKNIHLGLSVIREAGASCLITTDLYGCEDAGGYNLVFRKVDVPGNVNENYKITYGGDEKEYADVAASGYALIVTNTITNNESIGHTNDDSVTYTIYAQGATLIDAKDTTTTTVKIVNGYIKTLTIQKRDVVFYVGTYDANGIVAERYIIEQNEEVPEFPVLHAGFTTTTTSPSSKLTYYNTWFDVNEYGTATPVAGKTHAARQVRTLDNVITRLEHDDPALGVGICSRKSSNIQSEEYGVDNCSTVIQYYRANLIESGQYVFDTSEVGDYAIVRNRETTYITYNSIVLGKDYETKNYVTQDYNGTLVIYEDQTAPVIRIGNDNFAIEANANNVNPTGCTVTNSVGGSYSYQCEVSGLRFTEEGKALGKIISYITENYSDYGNNTGSTRNKNTITSKAAYKMPADIADYNLETADYQPVNNIGNASAEQTLYKTDRTVNTYIFNDTDPSADRVIDTRLEAVSSIISFYNINSFDYGYIRNNNYITKRYTPRYYFFIHNDTGDKLETFDPTYVGTFDITIYAIDNVGNQSHVDLTLTITDTTKPLTGNMHLFNAPVICVEPTNDGACSRGTINDWYVASGYVPISAFTKYTSAGVVDDVNGTMIKMPDSTGANPDGKLVNIYSGELTRYSLQKNTTDVFYEDVLGEYVYVSTATREKHILATEIEHKKWFNKQDLYLVVVGGSDNSYIDGDANDELSQWNTYYTVDDGAHWYKYQRHAVTGTRITFRDGVGTIHMRLMDSGTRIDMNSAPSSDSYYYNAMYLTRGTCDTSILTDCVILEGVHDTITQVKNLEMTDIGNDQYTFKINALMLTYNPTATPNPTVTWIGQTDVAAVNGDGEFSYGIMSCKITQESGKYIVNCATDYNLLYKSQDKKFIDAVTYTIISNANINDIDTAGLSENNDGTNFDSFYKDRRYVFIDTTLPEINNLNGDPFELYEYKDKCQPNETDERCEVSYKELFLSASDVTPTTPGTTGVPGATALSDAGALPSSLSSLDRVIYTSTGYLIDSATNKAAITSFANGKSGLLRDDSDVMYGSADYDNTGGTIAVVFNKHKTTITVYLVATKHNAAGDPLYYYYKYTAFYDGTRYHVYRQTKASADATYPALKASDILAEHADIAEGLAASNIDTTEEVTQFIASTASLPSGVDLAGAHLDFSINYYVTDAAGNKSAAVSKLTVRGVTYVRYESNISFIVDPAVAANVGANGNNTFTVELNQGASILQALDGFTVYNVDYKGVNHVDNLRLSLYYNGEVWFENVPYNANIIAHVNSLATSPGVYTIKVTNTRVVDAKDGDLEIEDIPLIVNINVLANVAKTEQNNYTYAILALIAMILVPISLMGASIIVRRRKSQ